MYIVMNHFSNENIGEFGRVSHFSKAYPTLEMAKAAVDHEVEEDRALRADADSLIPVTDDESVREKIDFATDDDYVYVAGLMNEDFERYHSIYAVIEVNIDA